MSAFISRKQSIVVLLGGFCAAAITAFLLNNCLAGPHLGALYDFLLDCRPEPPVSHEIVRIDTAELVEAGDVFTVLMSLIELNATALVVEAQVLGTASGRPASDEEIVRRFNDEYALLRTNIRNLFEAIRIGSVPPAESAGYVENLVELAEQGRDRLTAAIIRQEEAASVQAAQAAAVFGAVLEAADFRSQPAINSLWYARPRPDKDGTLRRIAPVLMAAAEPPLNEASISLTDKTAVTAIEHIVYRTLKHRWAESFIEHAEQGPVLVLAQKNGGETQIPLDRDGNILIVKPGGKSFRRIALERFREYETADRAMGLLLRDAETLGLYSQTIPERIPLFLLEYANSLREEMLEPAVSLPESKAAWIAARNEYLASLEELLYGPVEMTLVNGYEEILATDQLKNEGSAKLQALRDELIRTFVAMREQHRRLIESRNLLAETLVSSVCLMGPSAAGGSPSTRDNGTSLVESSALFANALLTGVHIIPGQSRYIIFWSLAAAFVILICIHKLRPILALINGLVAALLCAAGFCWSFIISAYWINPYISSASCAAGVLVMFSARLAIQRRAARRFRLAYEPAVSEACLKKLIHFGRPLLSETNTTAVAVIAIKDTFLNSQELCEKPLKSAQAAAEFRKAAAQSCKAAGAVIIAYEGDTVLACFGSPPETICGQAPNVPNTHPATMAGNFANALLRQVPGAWHFGIDFGNCAFSWSRETGYTANGRPAIQARRLTLICVRNRARIIITAAVKAHITQQTRKLAVQQPDGEDLFELLSK